MGKQKAALNHESVKMEKHHRRHLHHKRGLLQSIGKFIAFILAKEKSNAS